MVSYRFAVTASVIAWLSKLERWLVLMTGWFMFLECILHFKRNYKFRLQALSLAHAGDTGEPKFGK